MSSIIRALASPGIVVLAALILTGCAATPDARAPASTVQQAISNPDGKDDPTPPSGPKYSPDYQPIYPEKPSARLRPARVFRDRRDVNLNKMAEIGALSARVDLDDCEPGVKCDATAALAREAAAKGGDYVLLTDANKRERRSAEPDSGVSLVSRGVVYRVGDFDLLARAATRRVDAALRRAEAAERRAVAAHRRAAEARRALDARR